MEGLRGGHHVGRAEELAAKRAARESLSEKTVVDPAHSSVDEVPRSAMPEIDTPFDPDATIERKREGTAWSGVETLPEIEDVADLEDRGIVMGEKIGSGSYGVVHKARKVGEEPDPALRFFGVNMDRGEAVVVKIQDVGDVSDHRAGWLKHELEHTPGMVDAVALKDSPHIMTVVEFVPGDSLGKNETERTEEEAHHYRFGLAVSMREAARQLKPLHEKLLGHRDVKPDNIRHSELLPHKSRLIDFGLIQAVGEHVGHNSISGTTPYMVPKEVSGADIDPRIRDVYALALSYYKALGGVKQLENAGSRSDMMVQVFMGKRWQRQEQNIGYSKAEQKFADFLDVITLPGMTVEQRQQVWEEALKGSVGSIDWLIDRLDAIVDAFVEEQPDNPVAPEQFEQLESDVLAEFQTSAETSVKEIKALLAADPPQSVWISSREQREAVKEQLAIVEDLVESAETRDDWEYAAIMAQEVMAPFVETEDTEPAVDLEMDALVEEARPKRGLGVQLTPAELAEHKQMIAEIDALIAKKKGNNGDETLSMAG